MQLRVLLEQQQYEDMQNTSWADVMEEEVTKSLQSKSGEEVAAPKTQLVENDCIILNSDKEYPNLSVSAYMERYKAGPPKKKRGMKSR